MKRSEVRRETKKVQVQVQKGVQGKYISVRECHCCFCFCCLRCCFSWCCSCYSCFVDVFPIAVLNIDDLICQAGSLWPRMATVWKGSNPSSISPFPTARTFGFILSFFFLIWINFSLSIFCWHIAIVHAKYLLMVLRPGPLKIFPGSSSSSQGSFVRQLFRLETKSSSSNWKTAENKNNLPPQKTGNRNRLGWCWSRFRKSKLNRSLRFPGAEVRGRQDSIGTRLIWTIVKWFQSRQSIFGCILLYSPSVDSSHPQSTQSCFFNRYDPFWPEHAAVFVK